MANKHKFDKKSYDGKKAVKSALKADSAKKTTLGNLADRVAELEKVIGVR